MSMQRCEHCEKLIDTDFIDDHWNEDGVCMDAFPIHCKDKKVNWYYKIISETEVLTVRRDKAQKHYAIDHKDYEDTVTHEAYDAYLKKELEDITAREFFNKFTETNNHLITTSR